MSRVLTQYYPSLIPRTQADQYYEYLRDAIPWGDGIYSTRAGRMTRRAYSMSMDHLSPLLGSRAPNYSGLQEYDRVLQGLIAYCSSRVTLPYNHTTLGTYVNHYRNGQEWAPPPMGESSRSSSDDPKFGYDTKSNSWVEDLRSK